jgi:DNA-directed RNA polymerase subunit K/omega
MPVETIETMGLFQQALEVVKSRYLLCILVTQRIHQLERGARPTIDVDPDEYTSRKTFLELSLREITEGDMELEEVETEA